MNSKRFLIPSVAKYNIARSSINSLPRSKNYPAERSFKKMAFIFVRIRSKPNMVNLILDQA